MEVQLGLEVENIAEEPTQFSLMQKQFEELTESMGKVRRKLFSELGEMKKICAGVQKENEDLKSLIKELTHGHPQWNGEKCSVFDVPKHQECAG